MAFASLDFFLEEVFLWMTPVLAALSMADMAAFTASMASLFWPAAMSFLTSLTAALNLSLAFTFLTLRRMDCLMALAADLVFGIVDIS